MLSASGFPVPFSMRESVEAETEVLSATSRRLSPSSSRRRRTARPSSSVLTRGFDGRFVRFMSAKRITRRVLDARFCFTPETTFTTKAQSFYENSLLCLCVFVVARKYLPLGEELSRKGAKAQSATAFLRV